MTFTQIRRARQRYRANPAGLAPDADIRELLDDDLDVPEGFELVSSWVFLGQGYLDLDQAPQQSPPRRAAELEEVVGRPEQQSMHGRSDRDGEHR